MENAIINNEARIVTCCFSGHRDIPDELYPVMNTRLEAALNWMYSRGFRRFISGGAKGFDTYASFHVISLKKIHSDVELVLALPYKKAIDSDTNTVHGCIVQAADYVVYTSDKYSSTCMHMRNRFMVDMSSACICWMQHNSGGTAYTVEYAQNERIEIYNLFSSDDC